MNCWTRFDFPIAGGRKVRIVQEVILEGRGRRNSVICIENFLSMRSSIFQQLIVTELVSSGRGIAHRFVFSKFFNMTMDKIDIQGALDFSFRLKDDFSFLSSLAS